MKFLKTLLWCLYFCFCAASYLLAEPPVDLLTKAIGVSSSAEYANWKYIINNTGVEPGESKTQVKIEEFDPSETSAKRWSLVSINGQEPDKQELKKYLKHKKHDRGFRPDYFLEDLHLDSLRLVKETDQSVLLYCDMSVAGKDVELESRLHIDKKTGVLTLVEIVNKESFSPKFGVKIKDYILTYEFERQKESGLLFPSKTHERFSGSFMKLKSIASNTTSLYEHFEKVG